MNSSRGNTVTVGLIAALVIPRVQRLTGVTLTIDDVASLIALSMAGFHGAATVFERYFPPPPNPTQPPQAAK